jgi:hypothetical protein
LSVDGSTLCVTVLFTAKNSVRDFESCVWNIPRPYEVSHLTVAAAALSLASVGAADGPKGKPTATDNRIHTENQIHE